MPVVADAAGLARSVWIYRIRDRARRRRMDRLNAVFARRGDLVFDVGSHVGDRIDSFLRLGCRVVAIEPQPAAHRLLRALYARRADVALVRAAVGETTGTLALHLNPRNPTVATGSDAFIAAADGAPGWHGQRWTRRIEVPMTTLDALVAEHGVPAFVKIDVEGFEAHALRGLTARLPALSFEFTTIQRAVAIECLDRCAALGTYRYNAALGESHALVHPAWIDAPAMGAWLAALPHEANSGDVYAALAPPR